MSACMIRLTRTRRTRRTQVFRCSGNAMRGAARAARDRDPSEVLKPLTGHAVSPSLLMLLFKSITWISLGA